MIARMWLKRVMRLSTSGNSNPADRWIIISWCQTFTCMYDPDPTDGLKWLPNRLGITVQEFKSHFKHTQNKIKLNKTRTTQTKPPLDLTLHLLPVQFGCHSMGTWQMSKLGQNVFYPLWKWVNTMIFFVFKCLFFLWGHFNLKKMFPYNKIN